MLLTRPSKTCSFRRSLSPKLAPYWRPAGRDPRTRSRSGPHMLRRSRTRPAGSSSTKRIAPASSVGAGRFARRFRSSTGAHSRTRSGQCWIRSSACGVGSSWPQAQPPTRSSRRASPTRARTSWTWPTSTASRPPSNGRRPSPGRRPRSSSFTWGLGPTRPSSSSDWPTGSSTRTRHFGRRPACWQATSEGRPACGLTASRATSPSSWFGSTKLKTSTSFGSCSAPTNTGG